MHSTTLTSISQHEWKENIKSNRIHMYIFEYINTVYSMLSNGLCYPEIKHLCVMSNASSSGAPWAVCARELTPNVSFQRDNRTRRLTATRGDPTQCVYCIIRVYIGLHFVWQTIKETTSTTSHFFSCSQTAVAHTTIDVILAHAAETICRWIHKGKPAPFSCCLHKTGLYKKVGEWSHLQKGFHSSLSWPVPEHCFSLKSSAEEAFWSTL